MKKKIIDHLKKRVSENIISCESYSKSDDRGLCLASNVWPLKEMIEYLEEEIKKEEEK